MTQDILKPEGEPKMDERRFMQQEMLERLLRTTDDIREDLKEFTLLMTDRVAKIESQQLSDGKAFSRDIAALSAMTARHAESITWIKGAGAASVTILSVLIVWILNHLMFKS